MSTCATCRYFAHGDCHTDPGVPMAVREDRVACRFHALRVVRPGNPEPRYESPALDWIDVARGTGA